MYPTTLVITTQRIWPTTPSSWIRSEKSLTPDKPFFIYYSSPGTHAPSQVPVEWRGKYKGKFDEGWDKYREEILARQKNLGIVPPNTQLTPKPLPKDMPDWDTLSADEKKSFTRQEEIFAAYAEEADHEIGRVLQAIEDMGAMDNTLVIYITGDNGSSANGGPIGRFNSYYSYNQLPETVADQMKHLDEFGGPKSAMTPPIGWAIADNTPSGSRTSQHFLRRHHQRRGYLLAEGDQGERRSSVSVPSPHRYRSDCAGCGRAAATESR